MIIVPKRVLICKNPQNLCTEDCPYRTECNLHRTHFLIHAIVIHYKKGKVYADEYINEVAELRRNSINDVCHCGGNDLKEKMRTKIKLEAL